MKTMVITDAFYFNEKEGEYPLVCGTGLVSGNHKKFFKVVFSKAFDNKMNQIFKQRLQLDHIKISR